MLMMKKEKEEERMLKEENLTTKHKLKKDSQLVPRLVSRMVFRIVGSHSFPHGGG